MATQHPLEDIVNDLKNSATAEKMSVGELVGAFEDRPVGALITMLAFLALIPFIGGLPGAPIVIAGLTLAVLARSAFGHGGIWLPGPVANRSIGRERLQKGLDAARPWARRVDALTSERLSFIVDNRSARLAVLACVAMLAICLIPLGLIPAGIAPAAAGMLVFGLSLMARDGLLAVVGYVFTGAAAWMLLRFF